MRRPTPGLPLLILSCLSCAPTYYAAQAGPNSLECALTLGINNGYTPTAGGTNTGYLRLERRNRPAYLVGGQAFDLLTVTVSQGEMHIEATGFDYHGREMGPAAQVKEEADHIIQRCGTSDTTKVGGAA